VQPEAPHRLRRAEAVLLRRTSRIVLVLEQTWNDENAAALLRTADAFGVQHVWSVSHPHGRQRRSRSVTRGSEQWLSLRSFASSEECVEELVREGCELWVSDLSAEAEDITLAGDLGPLPGRVALVIGREVGGASPAFLAAARRRLRLPMRGFNESLNLTVAGALLLQRLFDVDPGLPGTMAEGERRSLRKLWYETLAGEDEARRAEYASWLDHPPEPLPDPRPREEDRRPRIKRSVLERGED